jgi:hypothetical protein
MRELLDEHDALGQALSAFDPEMPLARASTPPASWYTARAIHDLEREAVFSRTWQLVARTDQLTTPGDYVAGCDFEVPWLVLRDLDGVLHINPWERDLFQDPEFQRDYQHWIVPIPGDAPVDVHVLRGASPPPGAKLVQGG